MYLFSLCHTQITNMFLLFLYIPKKKIALLPPHLTPSRCLALGVLLQLPSTQDAKPGLSEFPPKAQSTPDKRGLKDPARHKERDAGFQKELSRYRHSRGTAKT